MPCNAGTILLRLPLPFDVNVLFNNTERNALQYSSEYSIEIPYHCKFNIPIRRFALALLKSQSPCENHIIPNSISFKYTSECGNCHHAGNYRI